MRTIKFRGKNLVNKKWEHGSLVVCNNGRHFITELFEVNEDSWLYWEVGPDTVGQFIGVLDKNGKEIYDGDIVDCWSQGRHCTNGIVTWMENRIFITIKGKDGHVVDNWHIMPNNNGIDEGLSVIGNIYDNPELLK